mmetsp:Transcript_46893/g.121418  ORF Transcript_46893/g.121418 Transcript_46893/m.121418 type:complete len:403 (-) Transcript_46893:922-2130(-)
MLWPAREGFLRAESVLWPAPPALRRVTDLQARCKGVLLSTARDVSMVVPHLPRNASLAQLSSRALAVKSPCPASSTQHLHLSQHRIGGRVVSGQAVGGRIEHTLLVALLEPLGYHERTTQELDALGDALLPLTDGRQRHDVGQVAEDLVEAAEVGCLQLHSLGPGWRRVKTPKVHVLVGGIVLGVVHESPVFRNIRVQLQEFLKPVRGARRNNQWSGEAKGLQARENSRVRPLSRVTPAIGSSQVPHEDDDPAVRTGHLRAHGAVHAIRACDDLCQDSRPINALTRGPLDTRAVGTIAGPLRLHLARLEHTELWPQRRGHGLQRWRLHHALGDIADIGDLATVVQLVEGDAANVRGIGRDTRDLHTPREAAGAIPIGEALRCELQRRDLRKLLEEVADLRLA